MHADRNLLFGILALQMDFIGRDGLIAAMHAWVLDKETPLGRLLRDRGEVGREEYELLEALVNKHLARHDNDAEKSLASLSYVESVGGELDRIGDPDLRASLARLSSNRPRQPEPFSSQTPNADDSDDPTGTVAPSLGVPTSARSRFRILRPHARGGLGQVSVALDEELHREVALKEIQEHRADDADSRSRFLLEAEITGGLEHPGIVPVYGLGVYFDGRPFYAMRFVRGESLGDALRHFHQSPGERTLLLRKLLGRFVDVCNAVAYAHSRGVLHRDIKPANILLGPYGETLVVDWGLARLMGREKESVTGVERPLEPASASGSTPTQMGEVVGTPPYMSPEQAEGRLDLLGPATDVYSLGATLYQLLTGQQAFEGRDVGAILRGVQRGEFPMPRELLNTIPAALEAICVKAMALRREDRYQSPRALADDVERWLADEPVQARREAWNERLSRWLRRHRTYVRAATAALMVVTLVALTASFLIGEAWQQERTALGKVETALEAETAAKEQEGQLRGQVETALKAETAAREKAEWERVNQEFERAYSIARDRNAAEGLLWLVEAAAEADRSRVESLARPIRTHVSAWSRWHHPLRRVLPDVRNLHAVAFSPDGQLFVTAEGDHVRVWQTDTGAPKGPPLPCDGTIKAVAFRPDGKRLLTSAQREGGKGVVSLWDLATGLKTRDFSEEHEVVAAGFSSDDKSLLIAADRVRILDVETLEDRYDALAPQGGVRRCVFSPDGKSVLTIGQDEAVRLWDVQTGKPLGKPLPHERHVFEVAFSPRGDAIVTTTRGRASSTHELFVWELRTNELRFPPLLHPDHCTFALSSDGTRALTGCDDKLARLWDLETGRLIGSPWQHEEKVRTVAFSPDGRVAATGWQKQLLRMTTGGRTTAASEISTVRLFDVQSGQPLGSPLYHRYGIDKIAFSPGGSALLTGGDDELRLWAVSDGRRLGRPLHHSNNEVQHSWSARGLMMFSPRTEKPLIPGDISLSSSSVRLGFGADGQSVVTTSSQRLPRLWEADTGKLLGPSPQLAGRPRVAARSPLGNTVLLGTQASDSPGNHELRLWDLRAGKLLLGPIAQPGVLSDAVFRADGKAFITAVGEEVRQWDATTGKPLAEPLRFPGAVEVVQFSPDGVTLIASAKARAKEGQEIHIWNLTTRRPLTPPVEDSTACRRITASPDGGTFLTWGGMDGTASLRELATGKVRLDFAAHGGMILAAAFHPGGKLLATGSADRTVRLWDIEIGRAFGPGLEHPGQVTSLAFNRDGTVLVAGVIVKDDRGSTGGVWVWDVARGKTLGPPLRLEAGVTAVALRPDDRAFAAGDWDGTARLWQAPVPVEGSVEQLRLWAQVHTGLELDEHQTIRVLDATAWERRRRLLDEKGGSPAALLSPPRPSVPSELPRAYADEYQRAAESRRWREATWFIDEVVRTQPENKGLLAARLAHHQAFLEEFGEETWGASFRGQLGERESRQVLFHFTQAILAAPTDPEQWLGRAYAQVGLGRWKNAAEDFEQVCRLDPKNWRAWGNLGIAHEENGRYQEAIVAFGKTIELQPQHVLALTGRGRCQAALGKLERGDDYAQALTLEPTAGKTALEYGSILLAQGKVEAYRQLCAKLLTSLEKEPNVKKFDRVSSVLWLLALSPESPAKPGWLFQQVDGLVKADRGPSIKIYPKRGMVVGDTSRHNALLHGLALYREGRFEAAIRQLVVLLADSRTGGHEAEIGAVLSLALARLNNEAAARMWLNVSKNPGQVFRRAEGKNLEWSRRLTLSLLQGEVEGLLAGTRKDPRRDAAKDAPTRRGLADAYETLGKRCLELGGLDQASQSYQDALALRTLLMTDGDGVSDRQLLAAVLVKLGGISTQQGQHEEALRYHERARKERQSLADTRRDDPTAQGELADSLDELGGVSLKLRAVAQGCAYYQQALAIRERLVAASPQDDKLQIRLFLSYTHLALAERAARRHDECRRWFERGLALLRKLNQGSETGKGINPSVLERLDREIALTRLHEQAIEDPQFALQQPREMASSLLASRVTALVRRADLQEAARVAEQMAALQPVSKGKLYNAACGFSLVAGAVKDAATKEQYAARALELLREAIKKGYNNVTNMKNDPDLVPLRGMPAFQQMVEELSRKDPGTTPAPKDNK